MDNQHEISPAALHMENQSTGEVLMSTESSSKNETAAYKRWVFGTMLLTILAFVLTASITVYIDPFFHYHAPLKGYDYPQDEYPTNNERYLNDGITRHFTYDSIITGTSMTENFKVSEANRLFGAHFIKVPFAGSKYREVSDNLRRAYHAGKEVRYIIWGLDYNILISGKNAYDETFAYPGYLYNDNPFDDVSYILNKSVLFGKTLQVTRSKTGDGSSINFDTYSNWNTYHGDEFGAWHVLATYRLRSTPKPAAPLTKEDADIMLDNLRQNVTSLADEHPETTFYLFFPPYSICYYDILNNNGEMERHLEAERLAIEELLAHPNIKLYSFSDDFELVCNLDHYKDYLHYGEWINDRLLEQMKNDEHLLTKENVQTYLDSVRSFYTSYDYASLHNKDR